MRRLSAVAAFVLALAAHAAGQAAGGGAAQGSGEEQAVLRLTREWVEAEGNRDRAALERIVAADFEGTGPGGNRVARSDVVPAEGARGGGGMAMKLDDLKARVFGDAAVVTGRGLPAAEGRPEVRFTLVYARRQGGWQMVAGHISLVPARE
jgi:ketosteroid isomerase-like protein